MTTLIGKKDLEKIFGCSWNTIVKRYGGKLPKSQNAKHPELYQGNARLLWKSDEIENFLAKL